MEKNEQYAVNRKICEVLDELVDPENDERWIEETNYYEKLGDISSMLRTLSESGMKMPFSLTVNNGVSTCIIGNIKKTGEYALRDAVVEYVNSIQA